MHYVKLLLDQHLQGRSLTQKSSETNPLWPRPPVGQGRSADGGSGGQSPLTLRVLKFKNHISP